MIAGGEESGRPMERGFNLSKVNVRRLAWILAIGLLALGGILIYFKFDDWTSRLTMISVFVCSIVLVTASHFLFIGTIGLLKILYRAIARTYMPELPVEAAEFDIALPSGSYFMVTDFGLAFTIAALMASLIIRILNELQTLENNRYLLIFLLPFLLIFLVALAIMGGFINQGLRRVLFISARENKIALRSLTRRKVLAIEGLEVWRYEWRRSKRPISLFFRSGEHAIRCGAILKSKAESQFYSELEEWLKARGAIVRPAQRSGDHAPVRATLKIVLAIAIAFSILIFTQHLVMAGGFWLRWLATDTSRSEWLREMLFGSNSMRILGIFIGIVFLFSPLFGWMWRLALVLIPKSRLEAGEHRIFVSDAVGGWIGNFFLLNRGSIREDEGALILRIGRKEWRIRHDQVIAVSRRGFFRRMDRIGYYLSPFDRPTELAWMDDGGVAHAVRIKPYLGEVMWGRRRSKSIFEALDTWRTGALEGRIAALVAGPRWPAPTLAAMFLIAGMAIPLLHNELLINKIFAGNWHSPSATDHPVRIPGPAYTWAHSIQAYRPGPHLLYEFGEQTGRYWRGDPLTGQYSTIRSAEFGSASSLSFPDATETWFDHDRYYSGWLIPPTFGRRIPSKVYSLATDSFKEVPFTNNYQYVYSLILYRDERILFELFDGVESAWKRIVWVDLKTDKIHSLPRVNIEPFREYPLFFPGGRYVLLNWTVVDLDTGTQKPIEETALIRKVRDYDRDPFTDGDRLRMVMNEYNKPNVVVEVDPATARMREIARFSKGTKLVSADGDRCLIRDTTTTSQRDEIYIYKLYDCATGKTREVMRWPSKLYYTQHHYIGLIAGTTKIIEYREGNGWREVEIGK